MSIRRSDTQRFRNVQKWRARRKSWYQLLRARMNSGLETCRRCDRSANLTFAHLVAAVNGGRFVRSNLTILCSDCQHEQGEATWHLPSLADEAAIEA